jgi:ABC-type multidrug transport system fused ATPase/permease subunit
MLQVLLPYAWPIHRKSLQFRSVLVAACLLASNVLNVLVPRQMGIMVDNMSEYARGGKVLYRNYLLHRLTYQDSTRNIWLPVIIYAVLLFVNGDACIGWIRKWLWLPLEQCSYVALSTASQAHIMSLSSDFHESDNKNTSDLMQAATTGRSVINLLETICFQVVPMFVDSVIAFGYLWFLFGPFMGLLLATTFFSYFYVTTKLITATAERRRQYTAIHRREYIVGHQSLESWNIASVSLTHLVKSHF